MADTTTDSTFDFNPMTGQDRENPFAFYAEARERPVTFSPSMGAFMVSRYADIDAVLADPETYSSKNSFPSSYDAEPEVVAELERANVPERPMLVNDDGESHHRARRVFELGFTAARVRALTPLIRARANELIDAFGAQSVDLVSDYAVPFVRTVIDAAIGLPAEDAERVQAWSNAYVLLINPLVSVEARVQAAKELGEYTRYLQTLIDKRRQDPRDDLISDLIHGSDALPGMADNEVHGLVRGAARLAGFDTTRDAITSTVFAMLQRPQVQARVAANPAREVNKLSQEVLRRDAPHRGLFRTVTKDTELGGTALPGGSMLYLLFGSGNRDERVFENPDQLELDRPNAHKHLAFGKGLHVCPGEPLARVEIRVAVETLVRRVRGLRLTPDYEPSYIATYSFRGLERLDVTWDEVLPQDGKGQSEAAQGAGTCPVDHG